MYSQFTSKTILLVVKMFMEFVCRMVLSNRTQEFRTKSLFVPSFKFHQIIVPLLASTNTKIVCFSCFKCKIERCILIISNKFYRVFFVLSQFIYFFIYFFVLFLVLGNFGRCNECEMCALCIYHVLDYVFFSLFLLLFLFIWFVQFQFIFFRPFTKFTKTHWINRWKNNNSYSITYILWTTVRQ